MSFRKKIAAWTASVLLALSGIIYTAPAWACSITLNYWLASGSISSACWTNTPAWIPYWLWPIVIEPAVDDTDTTNLTNSNRATIRSDMEVLSDLLTSGDADISFPTTTTHQTTVDATPNSHAFWVPGGTTSIKLQMVPEGITPVLYGIYNYNTASWVHGYTSSSAATVETLTASDHGDNDGYGPGVTKFQMRVCTANPCTTYKYEILYIVADSEQAPSLVLDHEVPVVVIPVPPFGTLVYHFPPVYQESPYCHANDYVVDDGTDDVCVRAEPYKMNPAVGLLFPNTNYEGGRMLPGEGIVTDTLLAMAAGGNQPTPDMGTYADRLEDVTAGNVIGKLIDIAISSAGKWAQNACNGAILTWNNNRHESTFMAVYTYVAAALAVEILYESTGISGVSGSTSGAGDAVQDAYDDWYGCDGSPSDARTQAICANATAGIAYGEANAASKNENEIAKGAFDQVFTNENGVITNEAETATQTIADDDNGKAWCEIQMNFSSDILRF